MPEIQLKVLSGGGETLVASAAGAYASLMYPDAYRPGDRVVLETGEDSLFCVAQFEDTMLPAMIYVKGRSAEFLIPPEENRLNYSPRSFCGGRHFIRARLADEEEIRARRCLSFNPYDEHGEHGFYPHAVANVETRGEAVFAARNAIDGIFANSAHGQYPFQSWGINRDPDAMLRLEFGRPVTVDEARLTLRADFPHDNYWTRATLAFSDGSRETLPLRKTAEPQRFTFAPRTVTQATLRELIMAEGPSPFPALTQIELFGTEAE